MTTSPDLHRTLLRWYARNARPFPWRETRDPYVILVSEIMLQQTQADRVQLLLPKFLERFPTLNSLARARKASVITAWKGMGYNRRAVYLHNAARSIVNTNGVFPSSMAALQRLPGVGEYTASAMLCFAFERRVPVVDVNIRRVLSRVTTRRNYPTDLAAPSETWRLAQQLLPARNWYNWNQALMDIGAQFCKARVTLCMACPLMECCASSHTIRSAPPSKKKSEPMHNNIPNRIWRGRIVDALRGKHYPTVGELGTAIDGAFARRDIAWLEEQLTTLVRDGLVKRTGSGARLG